MDQISFAELVTALGPGGALVVWMIYNTVTSRPPKPPATSDTNAAKLAEIHSDLTDLFEKVDNLEKAGYATHAIVAEIKGHLAGMGRR